MGDILSDFVGDSGGVMQHRVRYQNAFGVSLLIRSRKTNDLYKAIFCEYQDDFLCERTDGKFDLWQVKTKDENQRPWSLGDEDFRKTIARFADKYVRYNELIEQFYFASNRRISPRSVNALRAAKSPSPADLLTAVGESSSIDDLTGDYRAALKKLCQEDEEIVFQVLKRLGFEKGPELETFELQISDSLATAFGIEVADSVTVCRELISRFGSAATGQAGASAYLLEEIGKPFAEMRVAAKRIDCSTALPDILAGLALHEGSDRRQVAGRAPFKQPVDQCAPLRLPAIVLGHRQARPVNLAMVLGVDRRPAIAIILGADVRALQRQLTRADAMVTGSGSHPFAPRAWQVTDRPEWDRAPAGRGLIWRLESPPSTPDLSRALAAAFAPHSLCGDALVLAIPAHFEVGAVELVRKIEQLCEAGPVNPRVAVPIHIWSLSPSALPDQEALVSRLASNIRACSPEDRNTLVRDAYQMRMHGASEPSSPWRHADIERIRLHDLAVLDTESAARPGILEEDGARALISLAGRHPDVLYALPFLPVSALILEGLASASPLTRAVAGLLHPGELHAKRPPWSVNMAAGYGPAPVGLYRREV